MNLRVYDLIFDQQLLGIGWKAKSFDAHRALIRGVFGGPMTDDQRDMFAKMTGGRSQLARPPRVLVLLKSRRVAGTRLGVAISSALALQDWPRAPGERPVVKYFAPDRAQAAIAYGYQGGSFDASPLLVGEVKNPTQQRTELANGNMLEISTSDQATARGYTPIAGVFDEACYIPNLDELIAAMRPGLVTLAGSMLILISTPAGAYGPVYELDKKYFGVDDPDTLVIHAHVEMFNPTIPASFIEHELELDPFRGPAEWKLQWISALAAYADALLIDRVTRLEPLELAPRPGVSYVAGLDASGGRSDACAVSIAHSEGAGTIVDLVRRWPSPHAPQVVAGEVAQLLLAYGLREAYADEYAAGFSRAVYSAAGVSLLPAPGTRSQAYLTLLPLMTTSKVELPPDPTLRLELLGLERRQTSNGRDSVNHRPNGHDDSSNAVALSAWCASRNAFSTIDQVVVQRSTANEGLDVPDVSLRLDHAVEAILTGQRWR